jgi:hypothetical protein
MVHTWRPHVANTYHFPASILSSRRQTQRLHVSAVTGDIECHLYSLEGALAPTVSSCAMACRWCNSVAKVAMDGPMQMT